MLNLLRGIGSDLAGTVGFARGALEAVVFGGLAALALFVTNADLTVLGLSEESIPIAVALFLIGIRTAEGFADQIDPAKKRGSAEEEFPAEPITPPPGGDMA